MQAGPASIEDRNSVPCEYRSDRQANVGTTS